jgi:hypothetical protein
MCAGGTCGVPIAPGPIYPGGPGPIMCVGATCTVPTVDPIWTPRCPSGTSATSSNDDNETIEDLSHIPRLLLPEPIQALLGPLETAPNLITIFYCNAYHDYLREHPADERGRDPTADYLEMLCIAASHHTTLRTVCCADTTTVTSPGGGGTTLIRPIIHQTICPKYMSDQQCCDKMPFRTGKGTPNRPGSTKAGSPISCKLCGTSFYVCESKAWS